MTDDLNAALETAEAGDIVHVDSDVLAAPASQTLVRLDNDNLASVQHIRDREQFSRMQRIAKDVYLSGAFPDKVERPEQALIILLTGQEMGISPMAAMRSIAVFDGNAILAADLMVALVRRTGNARFEYERDIPNGSCRLTLDRLDTGENFICTWDRERVERGGINRGKKGIKKNWKSHEAEMLKHRCDAEACRALFPDVLLGVYTPDEREEIEAVRIVEPPPSRTAAVKTALGVPETPAEPETAEAPPNTTEDDNAAAGVNGGAPRAEDADSAPGTASDKPGAAPSFEIEDSEIPGGVEVPSDE